MRTISIIDNIVEPRPRIKETTHETLIDFLLEEYPKGFHNVPTKIFEDYTEIPIEEYDRELDPEAYYTIIHQPGVTAAAIGLAEVWYGVFVAAAINFAISYAINYVLTAIFAPDLPAGMDSSAQKSDGKASSVYNLNSNQNSVRLGQPIPVLYGRTRTYPSIIERPYYRYENNEQYLYQMMCVGAGKYNIDELLIGDSQESNLSPDDILYKPYINNSFNAGDIKADIAATFGDSNYHMRVNTLPEVSSVELRGTPSSSKFIMRFEGTNITFYTYASGESPDLSSIVNGSVITISGTVSNNGSYVASGSAINGVVPIGSKVDNPSWISFTTEPSDAVNYSYNYPNTQYQEYNKYLSHIINGTDIIQYAPIGLGVGSVVTISGTTNNPGIEFQVTREATRSWDVYDSTSPKYGGTEVTPLLSYYHPTVSGTVTFTFIAKEYTAQFETSYGAYTLEATPSKLAGIELDIELPRGLYNTDSNGDFTNRNVLLEYKLIGNTETNWINMAGVSETYTATEKEANPFRFTFPISIPSEFTDENPLSIRVRRSTVTPEPTGFKSQDMAVLTSVKAIYNEPDINNYGDITLLWARLKATNAISSAGQVRLNAWVTRQDKKASVMEAIEDIYTNTDYGAGLPASDLVLDVVDATIVGETEGPYSTDIAYYIRDGGTGRYYIYWGGILVVDSATLLPVSTWIACLPGTTDAEYMVTEVSPIFDTPYPVSRRLLSVPNPLYTKFNGALDSKNTVMDTLKLISKAGRYSAYLDGQTINFRKDAEQLIRTSLFNETNILKNSFKIDYLFGEESGNDGVLVKYRDPDTFKESQATYPDTSINPQQMELIGCTEYNVAISSAAYGYKSQKARKKIVKFKTDEQGLIPNYLDRIGVSHNVPKWGQGGQITSFSGQTIYMDEEYLTEYPFASDCSDTLDCTDVMFPECPIEQLAIVFRAPNGTVSDIYPCTKISASSVDVTGTLPTWLYFGDLQDNTYFSIGELATIVKDYTVTEIKPSGLGEFEIQAVNYDPTIYTYVEPSGSQVFTFDDTFIVPAGVTSINLCMIGGGGGGASADYTDNGHVAGGGHAGQIISITIPVVESMEFPITIGNGGSGGIGAAGFNGKSTSFGDYVASGGTGGLIATPSWLGNGGATTNCHGTYYDGLAATATFTWYGGQAGFGNGGDASTTTTGANGSGYGSGGGASTAAFFGGDGAKGLCVVSW